MGSCREEAPQHLVSYQQTYYAASVSGKRTMVRFVK